MCKGLQALAICPECNFTAYHTNEWYCREVYTDSACGHCHTGRMIVLKTNSEGVVIRSERTKLSFKANAGKP